MNAWLTALSKHLRTLGAAVLSVFVVVGVGYVLWRTLGAIGEPPQVFEVGAEFQTFSPFDRANAVLSAVMPLLSAVVGYWLASHSNADTMDRLGGLLKSAEDRAERAERIARAMMAAGGRGAYENAKKLGRDAFA